MQPDVTPNPEQQPQTNDTAGGPTGTSSVPSLAESLFNLGAAGLQVVESGAHALVDNVVWAGGSAVSAGKSLVDGTVETFRGIMNSVSADPKVGPSALEELVKIVPIVGGTKMYADAWQKYHHGTTASDPDMVQEARRECFAALMLGGLDVTTLGVSSVVRGSAMALLKGLGVTHLAVATPQFRKELLDPSIDAALAVPAVGAVVDSMLTSLQPQKPE